MFVRVARVFKWYCFYIKSCTSELSLVIMQMSNASNFLAKKGCFHFSDINLKSGYPLQKKNQNHNEILQCQCIKKSWSVSYTYFVHKIAQNIQEYNGIAVQIYYRRCKWHYFGKDQSHLKEKKRVLKQWNFSQRNNKTKNLHLFSSCSQKSPA